MTIMLLAALASDEALPRSEVLPTSEAVPGSLARHADPTEAAQNVGGDCRHLSEPTLEGPDGFPLAL